MTDTGEIIRMIRKHKKWTQYVLSEKSGVPQNTIVNVERKPHCRTDTFEKLLEAMGYEIEILEKDVQEG